MKSLKQDNRPSFSFYPKDWLSSKEIRISSFSARGLWIEILCLMFFEKKRGSLKLPLKYEIEKCKTDAKVNAKGNAKNYAKYLSELLGKKEEEIYVILDELEMNEVLSYVGDLMICRRMYYENEVSLIRRESALKRWGKDNTNENAKIMQTAEEEEEVSIKVLKISFSFNTKSWENINNEDKEGWKKAFPICDIEGELLKMKEWLISNPEKKKVRYRRFITNWLGRKQDKGGTQNGNQDKFNSSGGIKPPEGKYGGLTKKV